MLLPLTLSPTGLLTCLWPHGPLAVPLFPELTSKAPGWALCPSLCSDVTFWLRPFPITLFEIVSLSSLPSISDAVALVLLVTRAILSLPQQPVRPQAGELSWKGLRVEGR